MASGKCDGCGFEQRCDRSTLTGGNARCREAKIYIVESLGIVLFTLYSALSEAGPEGAGVINLRLRFAWDRISSQ
jgi:hypothetical protein